jgi:hypothetical protein
MQKFHSLPKVHLFEKENKVITEANPNIISELIYFPFCKLDHFITLNVFSSAMKWSSLAIVLAFLVPKIGTASQS